LSQLLSEKAALENEMTIRLENLEKQQRVERDKFEQASIFLSPTFKPLFTLKYYSTNVDETLFKIYE
jgi:hypothetical protein